MTDRPIDIDVAFREHARYVAGVAFRLLGHDDEVDDVVQETFLHAVRGLSRLRDLGAVKGWLATVAVRVVSRKLRWRRLWTLMGGEPRPAYREQTAPQSDPLDRELLSAVYAILDELPIAARLAWTLRHFE